MCSDSVSMLNKEKAAHRVQIEGVLLTRFKEVTVVGVNVDGKMLRKKARDIALSLGMSNFEAFIGWVHWFEAGHGLVYKCVDGEGKKVDEAGVND